MINKDIKFCSGRNNFFGNKLTALWNASKNAMRQIFELSTMFLLNLLRMLERRITKNKIYLSITEVQKLDCTIYLVVQVSKVIFTITFKMRCTISQRLTSENSGVLLVMLTRLETYDSVLQKSFPAPFRRAVFSRACASRSSKRFF